MQRSGCGANVGRRLCGRGGAKQVRSLFDHAHHTLGGVVCVVGSVSVVEASAYHVVVRLLVVGQAWFACVLVCRLWGKLCGECVQCGVVNATARVSSGFK